MPAITGRIGLILTVRDPTASAAWYQKVFGLDAAGQQAGADGRIEQVCLSHSRSGITLCLLSHKQNNGDPFNETQTGLDHVEFFVSSADGLDAWATWLDQFDLGFEVKQR